MKDGMKNAAVGYASTQNVPGGVITADLGSPQTIDKVVVWNRYGTDGLERIVGCELLLVDESSKVLKKWAFKDVTDAKAKINGAPWYEVGAATKWVLTARSIQDSV